MPGSERSSRALPALLARLTGVALALWACGYALATPGLAWNVYRVSFDDTVGHRLAGKLAALDRAPGPTVLVLGASTAREGFDERLLEALAPGIHVFNGGLAGGSVDTLSVAALMLRASGARPSLALVALHPWMLRSMDQDLVARGYADFFDWRGAPEVLALQDAGEAHAAATRALRLNTLWPPSRHARQLGRLVRAGLRVAHQRLYWGTALDARAFEVIAGDTREVAPYRFAGRPCESHEAMLRRWEHQGFLDAATYGDPALAERLERALRLIEAHAGRVAVVVMPEHSYLRAQVTPLAEPPFRAQLERARARGVSVLEHADTLEDADFCDLAHANAQGREALSRALAPELRALVEAR